MCGRFGFTVGDKLGEYYNLDEIPFSVQPRYNIAPGQIHPIVFDEPCRTNHGEPCRTIELMKWGFIPHWATDSSIGYKMINARAETVSEKPAFKSSFNSKRCLIPASFFYEWKHAGSEKIPYVIRIKRINIFSLAGLYDVWQDPVSGETEKTFTILTTEPNELVAPIHNRMPVIISDRNQETWLQPTTHNTQLTSMFTPFSATIMEAYPVSKLVNNPENDTDSVIQKKFE